MKNIFLSIALTLLTFGTAYAETFDIPVITGSKTITVTVQVEDNSIITATTTAPGVKIGNPVAKVQPATKPGEWAKLFPDVMDRVKIDEDQYAGSTFYTSKAADKIIGESRVYPYVGTDGDKVWFRLLAILISDDSLYFDRATVLADGKKFSLKFNPLDATHDYLSGGNYWDSADIPLESKAELNMLQMLARAKTVNIRFYTRTSSYDHELSEVERVAFAEALAVYELLGGDVK